MDFADYNFTVTGIAIACYVAPGAGAPNHPNRPNHGIVLTVGGRTSYLYEGGRTVIAGAGDLVYLPKGESYTVRQEEIGGCYAINFDLSEPVTFPPFTVRAKHAAGFQERFAAAEQFWRTKAPGYEMLCKAELYRILAAMRQERETGYVSRSALERLHPALEQIHRQYTEKPLSVPELASACGMSETYFRRLFLRGYGVSPVEYIRELKIARAKELLASGMYSVGEVAGLSGFQDECYFSREFRKAVGISPGKYAGK